MKRVLAILFIGILILSCSDNNDNLNVTSCDVEVIISSEQYQNAPSDQLEIDTLEINNDCLKIIFYAGGCNGDSWEVKLLDAGAVMESYPPQRNLRLSLKNSELCKAFIKKELTFDISSLQVEGDKVQLNITNSEKNILYTY